MRRVITYVSFFCVACVGESLDVGETDAGTGTGGSGGTTSGPPPGPPLPEWPMPDGCASMSNLDVVGTWEGAIQDFSFDTVVPLRVQILGASETGGLCGTLRWGEGSPPGPITDPEVGWPDGELGTGGSAGQLRNGTTYTILGGGVRGQELRFRVNPPELWKEWCSLQASHYQPSNQSYACLPPEAGATSGAGDDGCTVYPDVGEPYRIDEGKCGLCRGGQICTCNSTGCAAIVEETSHSPKFDLVFEENRATGTVEWNMANATDVLLTRVSE